MIPKSVSRTIKQVATLNLTKPRITSSLLSTLFFLAPLLGWQSVCFAYRIHSINYALTSPKKGRLFDQCTNATISANGRWIFVKCLVPSADTAPSFFLYELNTSFSRSIPLPETATDFSLSPDGSELAYTAVTNNKTKQIYIFNFESGNSQLISQNILGEAGSGISTNPVFSASGRFLIFETDSFDIFGRTNPTVRYSVIAIWDRLYNEILLASVDPYGRPANGTCTNARWIGSSSRISYLSSAWNLSSGHYYRSMDVFSSDPFRYETAPLSELEPGHFAVSGVSDYTISEDASFIAINSQSPEFWKSTSRRNDGILVKNGKSTSFQPAFFNSEFKQDYHWTKPQFQPGTHYLWFIERLSPKNVAPISQLVRADLDTKSIEKMTDLNEIIIQDSKIQFDQSGHTAIFTAYDKKLWPKKISRVYAIEGL